MLYSRLKRALRRSARCLYLAVPVGLAITLLPPVVASQAQSATGCGLASPAFCDTFDSASGSNTRAGDLDPVVWGVSRLGGPENPGQHQIMAFPATMLNKCGATVAVSPPDDVAICNGKMVESLNDDGGLAQLAMYPRQPFDIAGRTGKVAFDVSDDSNGSHAAWPEFSYTDQPIPVPGPSQIAFNGVGLPQNSINVSFAGNNPPGRVGQVCVDNVWVTSNYQMTQHNPVTDDCVKEPAQDSLVLNHFEVDLSATGGVVMGSDAGSTAVRQLTHWSWSDFGLSGPPLTHGLVWMKDSHYNANKACEGSTDPSCPLQQVHTFAWDNFGFDGPVLPRDLGIEFPDGNQPQGTAENGQPLQNLYFDITSPVTFTAPSTLGSESVPALAGVENASAALLEMSVYSFNQGVVINYAVNGNPPHTYSRPNVPLVFVAPFAMPVPLSELHDGANSIVISASNTGGAAQAGNVDLILVGAGGGSAPAPVATSTPSATLTPLPTVTASPTATSLPTSTVTPMPTGTSVPTMTTTPGTTTNPRRVALQRGDSAVITCSGRMVGSEQGQTVTLHCN